MATQYPPHPNREPFSQPRARRTEIPATDVAGKFNPNEEHAIASKLPYNHENDDGIDVIGYWAISAALWLFILAAPLLVFPRLLAFLAQTTPQASALEALGKKQKAGHYDDLTPLEGFLAQQVGWGLVCVAGVLICIIASPAPPPFPSLSASNAPIPPANPASSLRLAILLILSSLLSLTSFLTWNNRAIGSGMSLFVGLGNGFIGLWGFWVGVFGEGGRVSRKTGADKRTSAFPFYNKTAASVQKKEWKKERGL